MEIVFSNISKSFDVRGTQKRVVALDDISFEVAGTEFVCLLGPSGCGKSTLLKMVAGLEFPDSGSITTNGETLGGPHPDRAMVFQDYALFPWLTVGDGDAFSIGFLHLLNCARRNVDMTVVVFDNLGYQSTGGQYGVTAPLGSRTDSSPYGAWEPNWTQGGFDVLRIIKEAGAAFLARHTALQGHEVVESLKKAIQNPGFSLVQLIYPCVTHFGAQSLGTRNLAKIYDWFRSRTIDAVDRDAANGFTTGIFHDATGSRPEFAAGLREFVAHVQKGDAHD